MRHQLNERATAALKALYELGGEAKPGDVGALAGLGKDRQARAFGDLERDGLIEREHLLVKLTPEGMDLAIERPRPDVGVLDEVLVFWPYRHRAFVELLLSAIVARHHLGDDQRDGHLGFMALGGTQTGKSAMARAVCHLFGWDYLAHTLMLPEQTEGSVRGRRHQVEGEWRFAPAPATSLPFVLLDEFDKADDQVRRSAWPLFQGNTWTHHEGSPVPSRPTPMLAANPPRSGERYGALRSEYRRRSVLLDTGSGRLPCVAELRSFLADPRWRKWLVLDELVPPCSEVDASLQSFFESVAGVLTDEGAELYEPRGLELATLGRAGLLGAGRDQLGSLAATTSHDYLACIDSVPGLVRPGWQPQLAAIRDAMAAGDVDLAALDGALARAKAAQTAAARQVHRARNEETTASLAFRGDRAAVVQRFGDAEQAIRQVPAGHREHAARLRSQLRDLKDHAGRAQRHDRLAEVEGWGREVVAAAHELRRTVEAGKVAEREQRAQLADARKRARRAPHPSAVTKEHERRQRRELGEQLAAVRHEARALERLWTRKATKPAERPWEVLARIEWDGHPLVRFVDEERSGMTVGTQLLAGAAAALSVLGGGKAQAQTVTTGSWLASSDPSLRFPGTRTSCAALGCWGRNTRAVLAPLLAALHDREDQLTQRLDRAGRPGRPIVPRGVPDNVRQLHQQPQGQAVHPSMAPHGYGWSPAG